VVVVVERGDTNNQLKKDAAPTKSQISADSQQKLT
jgi:hypothetical protein